MPGCRRLFLPDTAAQNRRRDPPRRVTVTGTARVAFARDSDKFCGENAQTRKFPEQFSALPIFIKYLLHINEWIEISNLYLGENIFENRAVCINFLLFTQVERLSAHIKMRIYVIINVLCLQLCLDSVPGLGVFNPSAIYTPIIPPPHPCRARRLTLRGGGTHSHRDDSRDLDRAPPSVSRRRARPRKPPAASRGSRNP